jgi:hypothetical protein
MRHDRTDTLDLDLAAIRSDDPTRCRNVGEAAFIAGRHAMLAPSATGHATWTAPRRTGTRADWIPGRRRRTTREAQRGFGSRSPWLLLLAAAAALIAFGAVWLSFRGQHPSEGPTGVGLLGVYAVVLARIGTVVHAHRRATAGISGPSLRQRRAQGAALAAALVAVYVFMAALAHAGASDAVVYGVNVGTATPTSSALSERSAPRYRRTGRRSVSL